jgi:hypothetical protein
MRERERVFDITILKTKMVKIGVKEFYLTKEVQ